MLFFGLSLTIILSSSLSLDLEWLTGWFLRHLLNPKPLLVEDSEKIKTKDNQKKSIETLRQVHY